MLKAVPHVVNHVARYMKVRFIVAIEAWKFDVRPERLASFGVIECCKGSKGVRGENRYLAMALTMVLVGCFEPRNT